MAKVEKILKDMRNSSTGIRYADLCKVCDHYFGEPRQQGTSHRVYRMPWEGDPRVNIQDDKGKAKPYQVVQVIKAIDELDRLAKEKVEQEKKEKKEKEQLVKEKKGKR